MKKIISLIFFLVIGSVILSTIKNKGEVTNILSSPFSFDKYSFIERETIKKEQPEATLEISKINLSQKIYTKNSSLNNVDKNVQILRESSFPDENNGNVILAAHSGSGKIAYFKNLVKLKKGDDVNIYYNNSLYSYKVEEIYEVDKTGKIELEDHSSSVLTLITCSEKDKTKQIVIICKKI